MTAQENATDALAASASPSADAPIHPNHFPLRLIVAGIVGNVMEWYDFAVYGYFATSIGQHFFPSDNPSTSLISAFGAFAAGFLMRPLGGLVFGHIGDHFGRKAALTLSVLAMAIPTFLIGVLPGHQVLGTGSAVLLVVLRMIQGLSVGGEYTTSIVFLFEGAGQKHQGFASSWSGFGAVGGILLGSAVGAVVTGLLPEETVHNWAWRLPFLVGLAVGLAGLYVRGHIPEPPRQPREKMGRSPVWDALQTEWRTILRLALLNTVNGIGFYMAFVFLVTYMKSVGGLTEAMALEINTVNMAVLLAMFPLAGWLSDRIGRIPLLVVGIGGMLLFSWPLFWALHHPSAAWSFVGQLGFAVCIGLFGGVIPVAMVEMTPAAVRCSAISIGYNLCVGVLGGTTPMVAAWLMKETRDVLAPAWYLMVAAAISLGVVVVPLLFSRKHTATKSCNESG
ncbi:MAG TPA: MFS transporter [Pirellulaceae bacterium]|nr:MFS transporter [Pirellulaceae bacterium]